MSAFFTDRYFKLRGTGLTHKEAADKAAEYKKQVGSAQMKSFAMACFEHGYECYDLQFLSKVMEE